MSTAENDIVDRGIPSQLTGYQVTLRKVAEQDLDLLRKWRNLPEISQFMLSNEPITAEQQNAWFKKIQRDDSQCHFIIYYKEKPIGSANLKARGKGLSLLAAQCIEPGLYIAEPLYRNNIVAFAPTLLLNDFCFDTLKCDHLRAVVKAENSAALKYNFKLGYQQVSAGELIEIELKLEDYQSHTKALKSLLSRTPSKLKLQGS